MARSLGRYGVNALDSMEETLLDGFSEQEKSNWKMYLQRTTCHLERQLRDAPEPFQAEIRLNLKKLKRLPVE